MAKEIEVLYTLTGRMTLRVDNDFNQDDPVEVEDLILWSVSDSELFDRILRAEELCFGLPDGDNGWNYTISDEALQVVSAVEVNRGQSNN